jgi:hypothetical protein
MKKQDIEKSALLYTKDKFSGEIEDVVFSKNVQVGLKSERKNFHTAGSLSISPVTLFYSATKNILNIDNKTTFALLEKEDSVSGYEISVMLPLKKKEGHFLKIKECSRESFDNIVKFYDKEELIAVITTQNSAIEFFWNGKKWEIFNSSAGISSGVPENWIFVKTKWDLPRPESGVHYLKDNATYVFIKTVDLEGGRIVAGQNTALIGGSSEGCRLTSSGLSGQALITSQWSLPMRNITIQDVPIAISLNATGVAGADLDWFGVDFRNCTSCGTISNYSNFIASDCDWIETGALNFGGINGTVVFSQCLFVTKPFSTSLVVPTGTTINKLKIIYSTFVVPTGSTGINVYDTATIYDDSYIMDTVAFSGASSTYTTGVSFSDNKSRWTNCTGVKNSLSVGNMYVIDNTVPTIMSLANSKYFMLSDPNVTNISAIEQRFTYIQPIITPGSEAPPQLRYDGSITRVFKVQASITLEATQNDIIEIFLAKAPKDGAAFANPGIDLIPESEVLIVGAGTKPESSFVQCLVELSESNAVYVVLRNISAAKNVIVRYMNMIIEQAVS